MTRRLSRAFIVLLTIVILAAAGAFALRLLDGANASPAPPVRTGGSLVSSLRAVPKTFNRFVGRSFNVDLINLLTQARLARINRVTMALEPMLAESWTRSADNLTYTLKLRRGVKFSDGALFTAADVLFSFRVADCLIARCTADDKENGSVLRDVLRVQNKPLTVTAIDDYSVSIRFPSAFGPGLRLLDNLPIYPRHLLEQSLNDGTFAKAWDTATPPARMAGLGPFVLREYQTGQRLVFERNPNYWRKDASGARLPYLDRLTLEIVDTQDAEVLRMQSGQIDCMGSEIRPEDYATLKQAAAAGRLRLTDLGVGLDADSLWFNLRKDAKIPTVRRAWLQSVELRRAIAETVDRKRFADTVFLGAAVPVYSPVSPANKLWYAEVPKPAFDRKRAATRLAALGFTKKNAAGLVVDAGGQPMRFTLITLAGNSALERGAAAIRDDLRTIGIGVDVVPLEQGALAGRLEKGEFEALYYRFLQTDLDPALNADFWLSSGAAHVWDMSQASPATEWERRIDELMARQMASVDERERKALFSEVQRIFAEQLPVLYFAAPRVFVATSTRTMNVTPSLIRPMVLWSADTLAAQAGKKGTN